MLDSPSNRLIHETSPYLLQHAHNPVDWYPWGEEALTKAKTEDKPILLSIGYSACHWCHVMERESFENPDTAALMNQWFVCVKVDREERPDLDSIYMSATVAMNKGHGGWPMTVFLTPDQSPFFAGTYFPPQDLQGTPSFPRVLKTIHHAWTHDRPALLEQSNDLVQYLKQENTNAKVRSVGNEHISQAIQNLYQSFDTVHGGFGPAPKFPAAAAISLLLRFHHSTKNPHALKMAEHTLTMMANGGIYDHIGGGFARYSVDEKWLVPHFEKMLYDNALLVRAYAEGWQVTQNPTYQKVVRETLDFTLRELTDPRGGFYSALDADSEGEEGKFYVWSPSQIRKVLDSKDAEIFCTVFDITEEGNFEGTSIPNPVKSVAEVAKQFAMAPEQLRASLTASKEKLLEAREKRTRPGTDDKVITAWNGMMIGAMALGYQLTNDKRYLDAACVAADFIREHLTLDGRLLRTWRNDKAQLMGYLEDYAYLSEGLIDLYEAGAPFEYLERARHLAEQMLQFFGDPEGGAFYSTAHDHESLLIRKKEGTDHATPSDNAVAAHVFARLSRHFNDQNFRETSIQIIEGLGEEISRMPRGYCKTLQAVDFLLSDPHEIVLSGAAQAPQSQKLRQTVYATFLPARVIAHQEASTQHPLLEGRETSAEPLVYVCRNYTCHQPVASVDELENQLRGFIDNQERKHSMNTPLLGRATATGTAALQERYPQLTYRTLGKTELLVSNLGYGTYRIEEDNSDHVHSLQLALQSGINVIETSTSYTGGSSERLVGRSLRKLAQENILKREEYVIVSKAGYLQGQSLQRMKARSANNEAVPEIVEFNEKFWHCIHPEFLTEEITASMSRLGVETIDVFLLHNPEYFLLHAQRVGGGTRPELLARFNERMEQSFAHLEQEVKDGRIQYYGISSNTITDSDALMPTLNLEQLVEIAKRVGGENHHFKVVQCPLNLLEPQAVLSKRESGKTIVEIAQESGLAVLTNRPLNAILGGGLIRLTQPSEQPPGVMPAQNLLKLSAYEKNLRETFNIEISGRGETIDVAFFFHWTEEFNEMKEKFKNMVEWEDFLFSLINPRLNQSIQFLNQNLQGEHAQKWNQMFPEYRQLLENVCQDMRILALQRSHEEVKEIKNNIGEQADSKISLGEIALKTILDIEGVTTVLNGMRQSQYVNQALEASRADYEIDSFSVLKSLRSTARQFMRRNLNDDEETTPIL